MLVCCVTVYFRANYFAILNFALPLGGCLLREEFAPGKQLCPCKLNLYMLYLLCFVMFVHISCVFSLCSPYLEEIKKSSSYFILFYLSTGIKQPK